MTTPFEAILKSIQPVVDLFAAELMDVRWPDGSRASSISMIPPNDRSETELETGIIVAVQLRMFTVAVPDLGREPERDMEITWRGEIYRARNPSGAKVWEWQDHYQTRYRIMTERVPVSNLPAVPYMTASGNEYGNYQGEAYGRP